MFRKCFLMFAMFAVATLAACGEQTVPTAPSTPAPQTAPTTSTTPQTTAPPAAPTIETAETVQAPWLGRWAVIDAPAYNSYAASRMRLYEDGVGVLYSPEMRHGSFIFEWEVLELSDDYHFVKRLGIEGEVYTLRNPIFIDGDTLLFNGFLDEAIDITFRRTSNQAVRADGINFAGSWWDSHYLGGIWEFNEYNFFEDGTALWVRTFGDPGPDGDDSWTLEFFGNWFLDDDILGFWGVADDEGFPRNISWLWSSARILEHGEFVFPEFSPVFFAEISENIENAENEIFAETTPAQVATPAVTGFEGRWTFTRPSQGNRTSRPVTIEFAGGNFIITEYLAWYTGIHGHTWSTHESGTSAVGPWLFPNHRHHEIGEFMEHVNVQLIMGQRGTVQGDIHRTVSMGVFSYTDTQIELIFANGEIDVLNFSRTQNTLSLNAPRFPAMQFIRE